MTKEQLQTYRDGIASDLKQEESALQRLKLSILNKRKMLELIDEQISESSGDVLQDVAAGLK